MKYLSIIVLLFVALQGSAQEVILNTYEDSISYSIGIVLAQNIKKEGVKGVDPFMLGQAVQNVLDGTALSMDKVEADKFFKNHLTQLRNSAGMENKLAGEKFLAENAKKANVHILPSGVQYEVITEAPVGMPEIHPTLQSEVTTHYQGTLVDGTVFDSSVQRGEPITFRLGRVIKAWQEVLPLMKPGETYKIYSPYEQAYGEQAAGPNIKAFSALIFEIELISIN